MRRALPFLGLVALAAIFFAPELFGGRIAATANMARWRPWSETATVAERAEPSHNPDCNLSYYPRRAILHEAWRSGRIPLWNPYSFCGTPFLADVQAGVLYPPNWPLLPLSPGRQLGWFLFLHVAWGALGAYRLLRRCDVGGGVAFGVAAAFALNGYFAKHFGQPTFLATAAWVPWVLALALDLGRRPDRRRAAWLGLAGALMFLAGQPQTAIHGACAALLVLLVAGGERRAEAPGGARGGATGGPAVRTLGALAAAGVLAALLVGAQLLPTAELASRSARAVLPYATVISGSFHPVDAVRLLVPEFYGTPLTGDEWSFLFPRGDDFYLRHQLNSLFAGTPIFLLAVWGMTAARTRRTALPFTFLFVAAALIAFGSPLARAAYELVPGFKFSRVDRAGFLVILALSVPAGLAAAELRRQRRRGQRLYGAALLLLAAGLALAVHVAGPGLARLLGGEIGGRPCADLDPERTALVFGRTWQAALVVAGTGIAFLLPASRAAAALPLALAVLQLFLFAAPYRGDRRPETVFRSTPGIERLAEVLADGATGDGATGEGVADGGGRFIRFGREVPARPYPLSSVLPPSTNVPFRLRDVQGYNALADRRLGDVLQAALGENVFTHGIWSGRRIVAPVRASSLEHPLLDALAVRAVVSATPVTANGWEPLAAEGFALARNTEALPRVRLVPSGRPVSAEAMADRIRLGALAPEREVLWIDPELTGRDDGDDEAAGAADVAEPPGTVRVVTDTWNELVVETTSATDVILVVADSHSPGWRASVDGEEAEILPAYGVIRGVRLAAGEHVVRMAYRPRSLRRGLVLSLLGLVLTGAALCVPVRGNGPESGRDPGAPSSQSSPGRAGT